MITRSDILKGEKCPEEYELNLGVLLHRINMLEQYYGKYFLVTSGFRTMQKHKMIYANKGITDESKIPMQSKHLSCQAVDLSDSKGEIKEWIVKNVLLMEEMGLWFERFDFTESWVHVQITAPLSGHRFFHP